MAGMIQKKFPADKPQHFSFIFNHRQKQSFSNAPQQHATLLDNIFFANLPGYRVAKFFLETKKNMDEKKRS